MMRHVMKGISGKSVRRAVDTDDGDDWLITYSDLVTLILTFFILIAAISKVDPLRFERVAQSLSGAYGKPEKGQKVDLMTVYRMINDLVGRSSFASKVNVELIPIGVSVTFRGNTLFRSGEAKIQKEIQPVLDGLAWVMQELPYSVAIEGHTDDIPISSDEFPSNWELSTARASRVVRYLIDKGVSSEKLFAAGYADTKSKAPNLNEFGEPIPENRAENRRVEIIFLAR
ncbi:MAG: OmpA family protein [Candidatus Marinimicrobia bacterium]|nr:OmpA family protein [Candidatus Neomarinimicrobiota bacterium]MCH7887255.1 OmpA family protein [Candidatus Neomarinimicrobiota bacterium]